MFHITNGVDASLKTRAKWFLRRRFPKLGDAEKHQSVYDQARAWEWTCPGDHLSPEWIKKLTEVYDWGVYEADMNARRSSFTSRPIEETMQGVAMPLIREAIRIDPSIKSIHEIGAYYGYMLSVLAREYPDIKIHGSDLPWAMARMNAEFTEPNLSFSTCYPLDAIENGTIKADMVLTISTTPRMYGQEFRRYLRALVASGTRWFIANEIMIPDTNGIMFDPDDVDPNNSRPVIYAPSPRDQPTCFLHNYRALLKEAGFNLLHYHLYDPLAPNEWRLELVARR
jgi:hypothetical protein